MTGSFFRIQRLQTTNSTNAVAKEAALAGQAEGLVVHALEQTSGKGRHGRTWDSPVGNMYATVLLRPRCVPQEVFYYSFVAAMAVFDGITRLRGDDKLQLKWPNDVLVDGKKISGILIEAAPVENGVIDWIVVGVGINVASHPEGAMYPATSLAAEGCKASVDETLEAFLQALNHWRLTLKHDGFDPIRRAWLADAKMGPMSVRLPFETVEGVFAGLDSLGGLILRLADGKERVIQAGDIFFT